MAPPMNRTENLGSLHDSKLTDCGHEPRRWSAGFRRDSGQEKTERWGQKNDSLGFSFHLSVPIFLSHKTGHGLGKTLNGSPASAIPLSSESGDSADSVAAVQKLRPFAPARLQRACVLECGDDVCAVTALASVPRKTPELYANHPRSNPKRRLRSRSVAALQKLRRFTPTRLSTLASWTAVTKSA